MIASSISTLMKPVARIHYTALSSRSSLTKIEGGTCLNQYSLLHTMASSYAAIASSPVTSTVVGPNYSRGTTSDLQKDITQILAVLQTVTTTPDSLVRMMEILRNDMEIPQTTASARGRFGGGAAGGAAGGTAGGSPQNWRGTRFQGNSAFGARNNDSFGNRSPVTPSPKAVGRYQSKFTTGGNMNDKILNSIIGNKLNSFTPLTYNDTRDFIYQIMDSGETEFIKDFVEKVFAKATLEELYCALFAKLIAEIAHQYPVMYEEMKRYHEEFLKIFEDVSEELSSAANSDKLIKQRQYRLGYGQFISELASLNALEKDQLLAMVEKVMDKIWILTAEDDKNKAVEEFIDCIFRLTKSLREKSSSFFASVRDDMKLRIMERASGLIAKSVGARPSLSAKARFGLMDLKDIL